MKYSARRVFRTLIGLKEPHMSEIEAGEYYRAIQGSLARYSAKVKGEENDLVRAIALKSTKEFSTRLDLAYKRMPSGAKGKDIASFMAELRRIEEDIGRDEQKYMGLSQTAAELKNQELLDRNAWKSNPAYWKELRPPAHFLQSPEFYNCTEAASTHTTLPLDMDLKEQLEAHWSHMVNFATARQIWRPCDIEFDPNKDKWAVKEAQIGENRKVLPVVFGDKVLENGPADSSLALKIISCKDNLKRGEGIENHCRTLTRTRRNPHVVSLLAQELDISKQECRLFMEFVSGGNLWNLTVNAGPFSTNEVRPMIVQIARGLQYLHGMAVVHRDLKAENVLISLDGCLKICDLDTISDLSKNPWNRDPIGTPFWMAPEAARGNPSTRSDVWSLGCVALELLTKSRPWTPAEPEQVAQMLRSMDTDGAVQGPPLPSDLPLDEGWLNFFKDIFVGHESRAGASTLLDDPWLNRRTFDSPPAGATSNLS